MKEETNCKHEWRPVVSLEKIKAGYGSEAARIGSFCMKCKERRNETHLMEAQLSPITKEQ